MTDSNVHAIEIGSDKQLFIDQRFIESSTGVKLSMNPPVKAEPVLPFGCDTVNQCFWDARLNKYVAYVRSWHPKRDRAVSRLEVDDLLDVPWPHRPRNSSVKKPWVSALSTELPIVMAADDLDPPQTDLYTPSVHPYPWAQEVWWKQGPDVGKLAGRSVRLRIRMRVAKLVAFQFVDL